MTLDYLRKLAEAATPAPWLFDADSCEVQTADLRWLVGMDDRKEREGLATARYIAAANPAVVLALIAVAQAADEDCRHYIRIEEALAELDRLLTDTGDNQ